MTKPCPTCNGDGVVKSEETIAIAAERRLRELVAEAGGGAPEAYLVRMNPKVTAYFTEDGARMLHALEEETGRFFNFTGSEGLPLDHFAIVEQGAREAIEEHSVPFREGEEVHVDIVEPHMYSEDDAVAKVDGYMIEVADGIAYVGEKMLVRIEHAGRSTARAVLAEVAEEAAAASAERREARERAAKRAAAAPPRARSQRKPASREEQAVEALTDSGAAHAGTGPGAADDSDQAAARPRRGRSRRAEGAELPSEGGADESSAAAGDTADRETDRDGDAAVQSKPRRRGRRGGRRRSRANAAEVPSSSDSD
jgi:ribonuclease G